MADWPVESLGNKTLLQYAKTPYMDMLAKMGRCGMLKTVQDGFHPGSEVANSSILGYDQNEVYEGRGPLEAASIGVGSAVITDACDDPELAAKWIDIFYTPENAFNILYGPINHRGSRRNHHLCYREYHRGSQRRRTCIPG